LDDEAMTMDKEHVLPSFPLLNYAARQLSICSTVGRKDSSMSFVELVKIQQVNCKDTKQQVGLLPKYLDWLKDGEYFNDNLMDFRMRWLIRNDNVEDSSINIFSLISILSCLNQMVSTELRDGLRNLMCLKKMTIVPV
jgi:hypothetical protein